MTNEISNMGNIFGDKKIKVIRHAGDLNSCLLEDGVTVRRSKTIPYDNKPVQCAPYDNHFIFRHVFNGAGWTLWCTCGSPAGVVGYSAYARDASASGEMMVCLHHSEFNKHSDGSS